jgi:predicted small secreted protein
MLRRTLLVIFLLSLASSLLAGCNGAASASTDNPLKMAPMSDMPMNVQSAATVTQQAYQFAVANPDVMKNVPCYCGCGAMGHTSNYSCYVTSVDAKSNVVFDTHALGCSICVDITQDVMRLSKQGQSPQNIKAYVDKTYSRFGPSNMQ